MVNVRQLQKKKWARQPMDILCTRVRQLPMEYFYIGVGNLQLGIRNLPLDIGIGMRQLQLET